MIQHQFRRACTSSSSWWSKAQVTASPVSSKTFGFTCKRVHYHDFKLKNFSKRCKILAITKVKYLPKGSFSSSVGKQLFSGRYFSSILTIIAFVCTSLQLFLIISKVLVNQSVLRLNKQKLWKVFSKLVVIYENMQKHTVTTLMEQDRLFIIPRVAF